MKKARVIAVGTAISCTYDQFLENSVNNVSVDIKTGLEVPHDSMKTVDEVVVEVIVDGREMEAADGMMTVVVVAVVVTTITIVDVVDTMIEEVAVEIEMILLREEHVLLSGTLNPVVVAVAAA